MSEKICPVVDLLGFLSKKHILLILKSIDEGEHTFTGIKKALNDVNAASLSQRLEELEQRGFISRDIISEKPVKIRYTLTERGVSFGGILKQMCTWIKHNC